MITVEIDEADVYLPAYHHLLEDDDIDIELIYGGRDSGKSHFLADRFLDLSLSTTYFRGLLIKKTHESIMAAQWQMLKDNAEELGVDHLFSFLKSPLSIQCKNSNNSFLTRGMDSAGKIRSISNPTHAWIEEMNQISKEDFITILTSLRSNKGRVKLYGSFNPEANTPNFEEFWIYEMFFKGHENKLSFTSAIEMKLKVRGIEKIIRLKYRVTHVTYNDNPYVSDERIAFHEMLETWDPYWYQVYTLGLWGNQENDRPWAFAFNRKRHVSDDRNIPHPELNRAHQVYASFDFNRNPMACGIIQHYGGQIKVLEAIKIPKSGVDAICDYILVHYPGCLYMVTGDYSGMNESSFFQEQITHYELIKRFLRLSDGQLKVEPNPKLQKNSTHINSILAYYDVVIHGEKGKPLIFDMENVKRRADGTIVKEDRDDPAQQSDSLDWFRYFCNNILGWFKPLDTKPKKERVSTKQITTTLSSKPHIAAIETGKSVDCTKNDYLLTIRNDLLEQASKWINDGDTVLSKLALMEVQRLDGMFIQDQ